MADLSIPIRFTQVWTTDENDDYVRIYGIKNLPQIGAGQPDTADGTRLDSLAKITLYGLKNNGQFTMDLGANPDDPGQAILQGLGTSGKTRHMLIKLPDFFNKRFWHFDYVTAGIGHDIVQANIELTATCPISIVGEITYDTVDPSA